MPKQISGLKSSDFRPLRINMRLFPLDGADGLGSQVQQNAVDAGNFIRNSIGDLVENVIGDFFNRCGHGVAGIDGADDCGPAFVTLAVLDTDALEIRNSDEILPDLFAETAVVKFKFV